MSSIWNKSVQQGAEPPRPPLTARLRAEVLVIGGGMAGVLTARAVTEAGLSCVLLEAKTVGSGTSGNTTAKVTAQHGPVYAGLIRRFGLEKARQYYDANMRAVAQFRERAQKIACDFEDGTAFVYATDDRSILDREAAAYERLKIPFRFESSLPLPIRTAGALGMEGQARFNPLKFLFAEQEGLKIFENSPVVKIEGDVAFTPEGAVAARHIVLATHFPFVNIPGLYFVKLYQSRSYVLALEGPAPPADMYLGASDGYSWRGYQNLLLLGGGAHKTGKPPGGGWPAVTAMAKQSCPDATLRARWAAQDCMTLDGVPYIGRHRAGKPNLYVATGFNKWGMTGCMVAAELLRDLIVQGKSELEALYSPRRSMLTRQLLVNLGSAVSGLGSIGAPRCAHMGCKLHWNAAEKSWDCSCHGSRFDESGRVIDNPAKRGLRR